MPDSAWFSFWFAHGENPCHVSLVAIDSTAAASHAAAEAYKWLTSQHGRFPLEELRLVQGVREPLYAQDI